MNIKKINEEIRMFLNELSYNKSFAEKTIANYEYPFVEHIIKLAVYGKDETYWTDWTKWKDEIYSYLNKARRLCVLRKNKKLKPEHILRNLFYSSMETIDEITYTLYDIQEELIRKDGFKEAAVDPEALHDGYNKFVTHIMKIFYEFKIEDVRELLDTYISGVARI